MDKIAKNIWRYHDESGATSYLIVGSKRAVMIDCGLGLSSIMPRIRSITRLPVTLLLTHAHPDHYGAADEFDEVYLHERDFPVLEYFSQNYTKLRTRPFPFERLSTFGNDFLFDLGDRSIRVIPLSGHTPGSVLFADDVNHVLFTGDALGSGNIVLMAIDKALSLQDYRLALHTFIADNAILEAYQWNGGHYTQAGIPCTSDYNPLCMALAHDMQSLVDGILSGRILGCAVNEPNSPAGRARRAYLRRAGIVW